MKHNKGVCIDDGYDGDFYQLLLNHSIKIKNIYFCVLNENVIIDIDITPKN